MIMRKTLIVMLLALLVGATITSCTTTKTGCFASSRMVGYE
jgi:hypothetical protein